MAGGLAFREGWCGSASRRCEGAPHAEVPAQGGLPGREGRPVGQGAGGAQEHHRGAGAPVAAQVGGHPEGAPGGVVHGDDEDGRSGRAARRASKATTWAKLSGSSGALHVQDGGDPRGVLLDHQQVDVGGEGDGAQARLVGGLEGVQPGAAGQHERVPAVVDGQRARRPPPAARRRASTLHRVPFAPGQARAVADGERAHPAAAGGAARGARAFPGAGARRRPGGEAGGGRRRGGDVRWSRHRVPPSGVRDARPAPVSAPGPVPSGGAVRCGRTPGGVRPGSARGGGLPGDDAGRRAAGTGRAPSTRSDRQRATAWWRPGPASSAPRPARPGAGARPRPRRSALRGRRGCPAPSGNGASRPLLSCRGSLPRRVRTFYESSPPGTCGTSASGKAST